MEKAFIEQTHFPGRPATVAAMVSSQLCWVQRELHVNLFRKLSIKKPRSTHNKLLPAHRFETVMKWLAEWYH